MSRKAEGKRMKAEVVGRAAPPVPTGGEFITPERVIMSLRQRFNPIRILTPELLSVQLDQMTRGYLWPIMRTWDAMEKRDDRLSSVCPKRFSAVSRYGIEVVTREKSAAAEAQKEALEFFFDNCRTQNALDENEVGGVRSLLSQMARAIGMRYVCHEILWEPRLNGLTATFRLAPPWYFECLTGRLRFLEQDFVYYGADMPPDRWLVTVGAGIMEASSVAYMFKWMPLKDWVNYTEKYGMPGLLGECNGAYGSPEWKAMVTMLQNFGQDWAAVMSLGSKITPINAAVAGEAPFKPLVDQCDKAMTILWRGSDLGTMSHSGQGQGQGASLQQSETDVMTEDDALWLGETLNTQIVPRILQYTFGTDEALVELRVMTAEKRDKNQDLAAIQVLGPAGVPFAVDAMLERFDFPTPDEGDELLVFPPTAEPGEPAPDDSETSNSAVARAIARLDMTISNAWQESAHPRKEDGTFVSLPLVSIPDEQWTGARAELSSRANALMKTFGPERHPRVGLIHFTSDGRGETLHRQRTPHEFQAVKALPEIARRGRWMRSEPDNKGRQGVVAFHHIEARLRIGQTPYHAQLITKETEDGTVTRHKFYLHRIK
jgi:phage gp29-like protein